MPPVGKHAPTVWWLFKEKAGVLELTLRILQRLLHFGSSQTRVKCPVEPQRFSVLWNEDRSNACQSQASGSSD